MQNLSSPLSLSGHLSLYLSEEVLQEEGQSKSQGSFVCMFDDVKYYVRVNCLFIIYLVTFFGRSTNVKIYSYMFHVKAVPLQAWSGPEGSRKFIHFMTTAQDGGKVVSPTHRPPLPPENAPGTHFC